MFLLFVFPLLSSWLFSTVKCKGSSHCLCSGSEAQPQLAVFPLNFALILWIPCQHPSKGLVWPSGSIQFPHTLETACQSLYQWEGTIASDWKPAPGCFVCGYQTSSFSLSLAFYSIRGYDHFSFCLIKSTHPSRRSAQSYSKCTCETFEWLLCAHGSEIKGIEEDWYFSLISATSELSTLEATRCWPCLFLYDGPYLLNHKQVLLNLGYFLLGVW